MDTETQIPIITNSQPIVPKPTKNNASTVHRLLLGILCVLILAVGMGAVYVWQHNRVTTLNNELNNNQAAMVKDSRKSLDELTALRALPNVVVDSANSPTDLIAYLGADNSQCYKDYGKGYYKVVAQTGDKFAKMQYGCTAKGGATPQGTSPAYILAKNTDGKWSLINPTNQWLPFNGQDVPSCAMVNGNKVSKLVTPQCWQGPALNPTSSATNKQQRTVIPVTNP